jgi:hydrogenase expression/formation protein HypC
MCLAIPGLILELIPGPPLLAVVDVTGVRRKVDLGLLEDESPVPGDWVLIHVGFAMSKISEQGAREQMQMLRMLGEDQAAMEEVSGYGLNGNTVQGEVKSP